MEIKVKKLFEDSKLPTRGSEYAAGYDLYAAIDKTLVIGPHETQKVGTGLAFSLPDNTFAAVFARSGLATKEGLRPANCVGVCDSDYRGEYTTWPLSTHFGVSSIIQTGVSATASFDIYS